MVQDGATAGGGAPPLPGTPSANGRVGVGDGGAAAGATLCGGAGDAEVEADVSVQRALIAGNAEAAVDACFASGRMADALVIANVFSRCGERRSMSGAGRACRPPLLPWHMH
eukprot:365838-Chlamydomonas_euryale.AAC.2